MSNLDLYNALRTPPKEALKEIKGGRMNGKTDINPMWRIKALTERFGPCGVGWYYNITRQWIEPGAAGEAAAFCNIELYIKQDGEWSKAIPGTGGSAFVTKENKGLYTSDECYKMALTDALSVACKALGVAADVYWDKDPTKYTQRDSSVQIKPIRCALCGDEIPTVIGKSGAPMKPEVYASAVEKKYGKVLCPKCVEAMEIPYPPAVQ